MLINNNTHSVNNINFIKISNIMNVKDYEKYNYNDEDLFKFHLEFLKEFYDFEIIDKDNTLDTLKMILHKGSERLESKDWSNKVKDLYNNRCLLSGSNNKIILQACHIVELKDNEEGNITHNVNNGLCLESNYHLLFDKKCWTINPESLTVEISKNYDKDDLDIFRGKKIDFPEGVDIDILKQVLAYRYKKFD
jgi:hypothetical protein